MFPDLEFIKTCLNGLRSRIEAVENWVVSFMRANRPNWAQNDPEALDYVKGRTHYDQRVITTVTGTIAYATMQPYPISNEIWKALLTKEATVQCVLGTYVYDYTSGDWIYYRNTSNAGKLEILATFPQARFSFISGLTLSSSPNVVITVPSGQLKQLDSKFLPAPTADTAGVIKADAAKTTDIQPVRLGADGKLYSSGVPIFTTSGTGSSYTANVPEITELVNGMLVVMVPHVKSTTYVPLLNINNLGAHSIYRPRSSQTDFVSSARYTNWLGADVPVLLMYNFGNWVACTFPKPDADDLRGTVMVNRGGTGLESLTAGSYLVGNGTGNVLLKTPSEVLDDIGAIHTPTTAEVGQAIMVKAVDENGKPTEWEAVDGRSDWSENDETASGYVKNRPFYEEVKFITEGDIIDDNPILPEGKYELGKIYIVEVDGVQHQLEFMSTRTGEGYYYVGFNIRGTMYAIEAIDSRKPWLFYSIGTTSPADGLYSLRVENITKPAHARVLLKDLHKIDAKYIPSSDFDFDVSLVSSGLYSLTNLAQVQKAIDNNMTINIVYSVTASGVTACFKETFPCIKDCMVISVLSGGIIVSTQYGSYDTNSYLKIFLNADEHHHGVKMPDSASFHIDSAYTLVRCYASPF